MNERTIMKKIIDVSEIDSLQTYDCNVRDDDMGVGMWATTDGTYVKIKGLLALLDQAPSVSGEVFGYFKAEPFGWTDCAETDEGAIALYEHPSTDKARIEQLEETNKKLLERIDILDKHISRMEDRSIMAQKYLDYAQKIKFDDEWNQHLQAIAEAEAQ